MQRRALLKATLGGILASCGCPGPLGAAGRAQGCRLRRAAGAASGAGEERMPELLASSGVPAIDAACLGELGRLNREFGVDPGFGFFDDSAEPNAFAVAAGPDIAQPDGAVLMGRRLASDLHARMGGRGLFTILGVMAHEWGHLYQFKARFADDWGLRHELTADYLAGWYLFRTRREQDLKDQVARLFSELGDTAFADPDHHGTPRQRSRLLLHAAGEKWETARTPEIATVDGAFREALRRLQDY